MSLLSAETTELVAETMVGPWLKRTGELVWPSGKAWLVSRGTPVRIRFGSPFSLKVVVCGHCLVTLSVTIMKLTLKWLSSLPTLNAEVILVVTV